MRGILNKNKESKIYADGKTYDSKLYTFKECDYRTIWFALDVMVKKLDEKTALQNLPSAREDKKKNNAMIDKALEKEGIPINQTNEEEKKAADQDSSDEDDSPSMLHSKKHQRENTPIIAPNNINIQTSQRGMKNFCCTDGGAVKVGCNIGGAEEPKEESKCTIF